MRRRNIQPLEVVLLVLDLGPDGLRVNPSRPIKSLSASIVCVIGCK